MVDNGSADGGPAAVRELAPAARVIETGSNRGFAAACNVGAAAAAGELLVLLNPDAPPRPGWREAIVRPLAERRGWAAWQGLVTADGGRVVNSEGGVVHFTGIAWAGGAGRSLPAGGSERRADSALPPGSGSASGDAAEGRAEVDASQGRDGPREVGFASGACLAISRAEWERLGGLPEPFFLYHEDVDLALRIRLGGGRIGIEPGAVVDHDYEFAKGAAKWRYLERNRWATIVRTYPSALLALLAPALLATELALIGVSLAGGWLPQKLRGWADTLGALPRLLGERRRIQAGRAIGARGFAASLTADLDSPYLGRLGRSTVLRAALRAYWALVLAVLGGDRG